MEKDILDNLSEQALTGLADAEFDEIERQLSEEVARAEEELMAELGELDDLDSYLDDEDIGGITVDKEELLKDKTDDSVIIRNETKNFISDNGEIMVMDAYAEDCFDFKTIEISKIIATPNRIRRGPNVDSLVLSIKNTGLLLPIIVAPTATKGLYVLIDGYRRLLACYRAGKSTIPCIINTKLKTTEISVIEALYNHHTAYTTQEIITYINYLETEKGILNADFIEYILKLNSGDYTKLKDILNDNDDEICGRMKLGQLTIEQAFKKLEARRRKETSQEKENKKASKVFVEERTSEIEKIQDSGESIDTDAVLTPEEIKEISINIRELDNMDEVSLGELASEASKIKGFEPNRQDWKHRERLDPALRKAVLARDNNTCKCCGLEGQEYLEVFDVHHINEVYLGGDDSMENLVTVCTVCHKLVHLYGRGELHIRSEAEMKPEEIQKFKRIVKLGTVIRKGMERKGMKRDELKKLDAAETIGRTKPGTGQIAG